MGRKKKSFYGVFKGKVPGVYATWAETEEQVSGFPGAVYQGFNSEPSAEWFSRFGPGPKGGGTWIHARGIECGHHHGKSVKNHNVATCPSCRRIIAMARDGEAPPPAPEPAAPKPERITGLPPIRDWPGKWRVWNLRTGTWASELAFTDHERAYKERDARALKAYNACTVKDKKQATRRWALLCLRVINESNVGEQERLQMIFDQRHPNIAAKRAAEQSAP